MSMPKVLPLTKENQAGFTLIEMMIAAAVIAILAAIALPSYNSYIVKSEIRTAQADLLALSLNFENQYQRKLSYPTVTTNTTAGLETLFKGWSPSAKASFNYSVTVNTSSTYTLQAAGVGRQSGCSISITHANLRSSAGCKYIDAGSWL